MKTLTLTRPDDWHLHLRDGALLAQAAPFSACRFGRALVMPNLKPPVTTVAAALAYRDRILKAVPPDCGFTPYFSLYLTENTAPAEIARAAAEPCVLGFKLYPAGATTHSDAGVRRLEAVYPLLEAMEELGVVLQVHGEVTDPDIDIFDREAVFIERELVPLRRRFPDLKIVLEHVTTAEGVAFVQQSPPQVAATITPQHLRYNRNALLAGGIRPHYYCLPVLKREKHRQALLAAATSGSPKFFLGTDSAPHPRPAKENACGCAGCFTAPLALEMYAEVFEHAGALDRLEDFASGFGADFYGLPRNREKVRLLRKSWEVPQTLGGEIPLVPLRAGETLPWRLHDA
ncbi:dihydroorotase [Methylomarinovum caldicuralii]|uniref:Dihydroorotase n=1 Tax=Methylomarinovum caldicuralii TaxID=438856 RepID=A0AAU9BSW4_9GAMM|nr:dihydroorotase [Methylomarinovum caldicuralii]BCX81671.1 dihydroorotase [Methylomarinovum caldicuralii]